MLELFETKPEHMMMERNSLHTEKEPITAGIVAEYNPFHKGHAWQVNRLREGGVDFVVCVMSGSFVQRAEAAYLPTNVRAQAALAGGVDLVLRLPVPYATASAEGFARGAVGLLSALGCVDILSFGAECDNKDQLEDIAGALISEEFSPLLKAELAKGVSFAAARAAAVENIIPGSAEVLRSPNNILGIEYIKALLDEVPYALRMAMPPDIQWQVVEGLFGNTTDRECLFPLPIPMPLPRVGAAHDGSPKEGYASASWLRKLAREKNVEEWKAWVSEACMPLYKKAQEDGMVLDYNRYEMAVMSRLRGKKADEFAKYPGAGEGLESRMEQAVNNATCLEEMFEIAKSKRFTHSRVRRLAISAMLDLPKYTPVISPFAHILAANGRGLALLKRIKRNTMIPVSTSLAKLAKTSTMARDMVQWEASAEDLHALCLQKPRRGGGAYTQPAAIQGKSGLLPFFTKTKQ